MPRLDKIEEINNRSDLPDIKNVKKLIYTTPGYVRIDDIIYIGDEVIISAYIDEVNCLLMGEDMVKSPKKWLNDPKWKYYSKEFKNYLISLYGRPF